jgi:hypothetical protein
LSRLGDGTHLRLEEKKPKKGKRGGIQVSFLSRLGHGALKATKRKRKKGEQAPSMLNLGNGILETTKKNKKKDGASCFSIESW